MKKLTLKFSENLPDDELKFISDSLEEIFEGYKYDNQTILLGGLTTVDKINEFKEFYMSTLPKLEKTSHLRIVK